jgi:hypothetical protein
VTQPPCLLGYLGRSNRSEGGAMKVPSYSSAGDHTYSVIHNTIPVDPGADNVDEGLLARL